MKNSFPIVNFDWEELKYISMVRLMTIQLGLNGKDMFFDSKMRNQKIVEGLAPAYCLDLYEQLKDIAELEYQKLL